MQIDRESLVNELESVSPGLSPRDLVEQSSCFVFVGGKVITYNDEVACFRDTCLPIEGAVPAAPLKQILSRLAEDVLDVQVDKKENVLVLRGKSRRSGIRMEQEITLPYDVVDSPAEWHELPGVFCDAVDLVRGCASKDGSKRALVCIHLTPDYLEACDDYQLSRYYVETGLTKSILVYKNSMEFVSGLGVTEFGLTDSWIHFRNGQGLTISCRLSEEEYPNLDPILEVKGKKAELPPGLKDAADRANVFSQENADNDQILVKLEAGRLRLRGEGITGYHIESKKFKYEGPPLSFMIPPNLLGELTERHTRCIISKDRLRINQGKRFVYVTCLGVAD